MRSPFRRGGGRSSREQRDVRNTEIEMLRVALLEERTALARENERRELEAAGAVQRNPRPISATEEHELAVAGVTTIEDETAKEQRAARLRALDRALAAIGGDRFGICTRCGQSIEIARLHAQPDTTLCGTCARVALPPAEPPGEPTSGEADGAEPRPRTL
jgi:RNA polymerase-binding transcription factor DksA